MKNHLLHIVIIIGFTVITVFITELIFDDARMAVIGGMLVAILSSILELSLRLMKGGDELSNEAHEYDVFVSYSSLDQEQATLIYKAILSVGGKVFLSAKSLHPGDDFASEIRKNLISSRQLWLLISPNSLHSEWVITEWGVAWGLQKRIIPILHGCTAEELPLRLRGLHCIDFSRYHELVQQAFRLTRH
jgi:hypothetical protein